MSGDSVIKLRGGSLQHEIHGYYRTAEGRNFLRELYPSYLEWEGFKERKLASAIADQTEPDQQRREADLTKSALRRWREDGQSELWGKDLAKTLRLMERLEWNFMQVPRIKQILDDQAADIHKVDVGNSLGVLFFGARPSTVTQNAKDRLLNSRVGLFWAEEASWGSAKYDIEYYAYYARAEGCDFLLVHEFAVDQRYPQLPRLTSRNTGYAIPTADDELHRFMLGYRNPTMRRFEVLTLVAREFGDRPLIRYHRAHHYVDLNIEPVEDEFDRKYITYFQDDNPFIRKYIERLLWDIII